MIKEFSTRPVEGYCGHFEEERTIKVKGQKVPIAGKPWPDFVPTVNFCEDLQECPYGRKCPIFLQAHMEW